MGGGDDPENLIELTIEEHALAHKKLWEEHGKEEDRIAWHALSGQIKMTEATKQAQRMGALRGSKAVKNHRAGGVALMKSKEGERIRSMGGKVSIHKNNMLKKGYWKWANNGIKNTKVPVHELETYLLENPDWKAGRLGSGNKGKFKILKNPKP